MIKLVQDWPGILKRFSLSFMLALLFTLCLAIVNSSSLRPESVSGALQSLSIGFAAVISFFILAYYIAIKICERELYTTKAEREALEQAVQYYTKVKEDQYNRRLT